jgi:hypothetical protein
LASTTIPGVDSSFKLDNFKQGLNIEITKYENHDMEFEIKGISCAVSESLGLQKCSLSVVTVMALRKRK